MSWDFERVRGFLGREQRRLEQDIKTMKDQMALESEHYECSGQIAEAEGQLTICTLLKSSEDLHSGSSFAAGVARLKSQTQEESPPRRIPRTRESITAYKRGRLKMIKALERKFLAEVQDETAKAGQEPMGI